jgi:hypothetical protein
MHSAFTHRTPFFSVVWTSFSSADKKGRIPKHLSIFYALKKQIVPSMRVLVFCSKAQIVPVYVLPFVTSICRQGTLQSQQSAPTHLHFGPGQHLCWIKLKHFLLVRHFAESLKPVVKAPKASRFVDAGLDQFANRSCLSIVKMSSHEQPSKRAKHTFSPAEALGQKATEFGCDVSDEKFALEMDKQDKLHALRSDFCIPKAKEIPTTECSLVEKNGELDCLYFCGNSLGLMPKKAKEYVMEDMEKWGKMGVHGNFEFCFRTNCNQFRTAKFLHFEILSFGMP